VRNDTPTARTLELRVDDWPRHEAGQHVDVRLTAPDGYTATRSYSLASPPGRETVEITVEAINDGEVSPYLTSVAAPGDRVELRGPIGGWFVWRPAQTEAVQLIAGGSGVVPLMAMIRARNASGSAAPFRLLYSVRRPDAVIYANELQQIAAARNGVEIEYAYTREVPAGWTRPAKRVDATVLAMSVWPASDMPTVYACGPTAFVESVADLLRTAGHDASRIKTERFGPSGGQT